MTIAVEVLKAAQTQLESAHKEISAELRAYPRSASGLTEDAAKDDRWHTLKTRQTEAFNALRLFNKRYAKIIRKFK